ncbi:MULTISPECIES: transglutaminase-like domain-containing protein [Leeuwenhoekiella]|jgi:transglutaminase-like putative cysteine protease|uniref:Transglutaminase-like domain-containing protein n=1 Tax=Leeuwenhoekiella blandensis (strain CECT 7118 / CCUG 51940 / KCTC 22103 / MED217) TaxID=398720 RepID=A3XLD1_LEEBM|nr:MULTISPECIES: transglutaminase domain-containing protein [Leeuwenhoekiella]EAQ49636.1 hypothetical protein MED217_12294 [Leeuwenhoekiella blandensis MED217]MAO42227.1 hypothetical protein [Leeuwenhoekiella sp.]MBQ51368.1 hypothetical protein [Leeuwenhoekiella sp.]HCW65002.1 transglutaminase domain-containing protein [Leeuwenhoekiella sp.]|tara:strand:+ start:1580 stop:2458 length:879 start_codon:yes stop_codon:yes gene_type:complete
MTILKYALILSLILFHGRAFAQTSSTQKVEIAYMITPSAKTKKIKFRCLVPRDIPNIQKIKNIKYSIAPTSIIEEGDSRYANFLFTGIHKPISLKIKYTIALEETDLAHPNKLELKQSTPLDSFLIEERFIELSDPLIASTAQKLKDNDTLGTVKNIYQFVSKKLKYGGFNTADIGAAKALRQKEGDCTEFTDLFVALCRINGIPARVIDGYKADYNNTPLHSWPEAYIKEYGWIRFDPTPGNAIDFTKLRPTYIQLSTLRNNPKLNNGHFWSYTYWGEKISVNEKISITSL